MFSTVNVDQQLFSYPHSSKYLLTDVNVCGAVQYIDMAVPELQLIECVARYNNIYSKADHGDIFIRTAAGQMGALSRILLKKVFQKDWKWYYIQPSMVTHTRNSCSAINPSKVHTHSSEHTHTVNTHPEQWAAIYGVAPREQLWVRWIAEGHFSRGIEGEESTVH